MRYHVSRQRLREFFGLLAVSAVCVGGWSMKKPSRLGEGLRGGGENGRGLEAGFVDEDLGEFFDGAEAYVFVFDFGGF